MAGFSANRRFGAFASVLALAVAFVSACSHGDSARPIDPEEKLALVGLLERGSRSGQPSSLAELGFVLYMTGDEVKGLELMEPAVRAGSRHLPSELIVLRRSFESAPADSAEIDLKLSQLLLPVLRARDSALEESVNQESVNMDPEEQPDPQAEAMRAAERDLVRSARWLAERRTVAEEAERLVSALSLEPPAPSRQGASRESSRAGAGATQAEGSRSAREDAVALMVLHAGEEHLPFARACTEALLDTLTGRGWVTEPSFLARQCAAEIDRAAASKPRVRGFDSILRTRGIQQRLGLLGRKPNEPSYYEGPEDGQMNAATTRAIRLFQLDHGLNPDGVAGPRTRAAIERAIDARYELARPEVKLQRAVRAGLAAGCRFTLQGSLSVPEPDRVRVALDLVDGFDNAILHHAEVEGAMREVRVLLGDLAQEIEPHRPGRGQIVLPADSEEDEAPTLAVAGRVSSAVDDDGLAAGSDPDSSDQWTNGISRSGTPLPQEEPMLGALRQFGRGLTLVEEGSFSAAATAFESAARTDSTLTAPHRWHRNLALFTSRMDRYLDAVFAARVATFRKESR